MARKLTHKEKGFVRDIGSGLPGVQAALNNYDTKNYHTAGAIAHENLKKPKIQQALEEAFPDTYLARIHNEGLNASKGIYRQTDDYTWTKIDEVPDYPVIGKFLDMAYKIKGSYAPEKQAHVHIHVEPSDRIKRLTKHLNR